MNLVVLFIILNVVNVVAQTTNHIITVKCGKWLASFSNMFTFAFYTVVIVYMQCELPLFVKCFIVGACNFVGVLIVKTIEEKAKKKRGKQ